MDLYKEYKELYYKEIEHSDRLNNRLSTNLTILTVYGAGIFYLSNDYSCIVDYKLWSNLVLLALTILSTILTIICIVSFVRAYSGYNYDYFPTKDVKKYIDDTILYYQSDTNESNKYIPNDLANIYIACAINNREENIEKSKRHRFLTVWIIRTFVLFLSTFLFRAIF